MNIEEAHNLALATLKALCRIPTVPYHEAGVARHIRSAVGRPGLEVSHDAYGNLLATRHGTEPAAPALALVAHMDHPGFEAVAIEDGALVANVLGGITRRALEPGVAVSVIAADGGRAAGVVTACREVDGRPQLLIETESADVGELPRPVILALPDFELDGDLIRARALDDLAGCATIVAVLASAAGQPSPGAVYGLFTRAEEVGLVGARLAAEGGLLPEGTSVISVETSHALPGAEIGGGVVIRTGDRGTTFDDAAEAYLRAAAAELVENEAKGFMCGRQLMSGGGCEASAFAAFGYSVTGTAYPLGNWHNGLVQGVVEPEHIDLNDFHSGVTLLSKAAELAGTGPRSLSAQRLGVRPSKEATRLAGRSAFRLGGPCLSRGSPAPK